MYGDENFLAHHGIKGQKWGVRRFQNPDGTRTPAGRRRERNREPTREELLKSTNANEVYKHRDKLSDKELRERVNRIQTEQQLRDLAKREKTADHGETVASKVLKKIGEKTAEAVAVAVVGATVGAGIKYVKDEGLANVINDGYHAARSIFGRWKV